MTNKAVLIAGYYGFGNTGDEAILSGIIAGLRAQKQDLILKVVTANPEQTKEDYDVETVLWNDIPDLIASVKSSDLVILGGGGLFHDYWGVDESTLLTSQHAGLPYFAGIPLLASLLEKPCMIYAVGVGPLLTDQGKRLTKMAFERCQAASVRDSYSKDALRELDVDLSEERVLLFADPAFTQPLAESGTAKSLLKTYGVQDELPTLGVVLRYWDIGVEPALWEAEVSKTLDAWIEANHGQVVFLPFQKEAVSVYEDDHATAMRVVGMMKQADHCTVIEEVLPSGQLGALIGEFDCVIGMRLHALIFALRAAKPVVALAYDPKVEALMERAGLSAFSLGLDQWSAQEIQAALDQLAETDLRKQMKSHASEMRKLAAKNVKLALKLLKKPGEAPIRDDPLLRDLLLDKVRQQFDLEDQFNQARKVAEQHAGEIESLAKTISSVEENRERLQELIGEKDDAIARFSDQIAEKNQAISDLAAAIAERDSHIDEVKQMLSESESRIDALKLEVSEAESRINALKLEVSEAESRINALSQQVNKREEQITHLSGTVSDQETQITTLREELARETQAYAAKVQSLEGSITEQNLLVGQLEATIAEKDYALSTFTADLRLRNEMILEKDQAIHTMSEWIGEVKWSRAWRFVRALWRVRLLLAPHGSLRERWLQRTFGVLLGIRSLVPPRPERPRRSLGESLRNGFKRFVRPRGAFSEEYIVEDYSQTILYTDQADLFPAYQPRRTLDAINRRSVKISLIATVWNAGESLDEWLKDLEMQTRQPDEVVIVDGGSTDGTLESLHAYAQHSSIPFKVLSEPGANIALGRNLAIEAAGHEVIVCADFGSSMMPEYVEQIVIPFEDDPEMQVVGGWYEARIGEKLSTRRAWPTLDQIWPPSFLPSARSMAYTREAWLTVGRHPDWLSLTGDDTLFALELKKLCPRWAFVPSAVAIWHAPPNGRSYWHKVRSWSVGDGETTVNSRFYWNSLLRISFLASLALLATISVIVTLLLRVPWTLIVIGPLFFFALGILVLVRDQLIRKPSDLIWETGAEIARVRGYLKGARQRQMVRQRRVASLRGVYFILSGVPIDDTGGGARGTQIALELLNRQNAVVFIHRFPRGETVDLDLRFEHPYLYNASLEDFRYEDLEQQYPEVMNHGRLAAIVEFPLEEFIPVMQRIRAEEGVVIFDLLDDWNTSLGGSWYSQEGEARVVSLSQLLVATEESLAGKLKTRFGRDVLLLPNAVNQRLFNPDRSYQKPADMPHAEWSMIYIGALWGNWLDWDLLVESARAYPDAAVIVIGDYRGECPDPPENLHFLGLKPQKALPGYLAHSNVALIPWKVSAITQATSPLKVYEYLAMRLPVVAPAMNSLLDLPGVFCAGGAEQYIHLIQETKKLGRINGTLSQFIRENSWEARINQLESAIEPYIAHKASGNGGE